MKKFTKLLGIVLIIALVMSLSVSAFAADTSTPTPVTPDAESGFVITMSTTADHSYTAYQVFAGDLAEDANGNLVLSNITWGNGVDGDDLLTALKGDTTYGSDFSACTSAADVAEVLSGYDNDSAGLIAISKIIENNTKGTGTTGTTKIEGLAAGYYLIVDSTDEDDMPEGQTYSDFMLKVVNDITVTAKDTTTTSEKKVQEKNDTTGSTTNWQDAADYDIGDKVPFKLTGKVAGDYAKYDHYYFAFHDEESDGLAFDASTVKVYLGETGTTEIDDSYYTIKTTGFDDDCTFEIIFNDLKTIKDSSGTALIGANSVIRVEYESELTEDAVIGSQGNPNVSYIEFSNNPNGTQHGKTPEDKVIVFTYKIEALKVEPDGAGIDATAYSKLTDAEKADYVQIGTKYFKTKELEGAGFTLYKKVPTGTQGADADGYLKIGREITGVTTFTFNGQDAGEYKLVETTVPTGYNKCADIVIKVEATYDTDSADPKLKTLTVSPATAGFVVESTTTEATADTAAVTTYSGVISGKVVNQSGAVLPSTGGIGTTIFYVVGRILVVAAGVLLITKKRMGRE